MSDRREFIKKAIGAAGAAAATTATIQGFEGSGFEKPYERLVVEIRMSPGMRERARHPDAKELREFLAQDASRVAIEAMRNDDGTNPPII